MGFKEVKTGYRGSMPQATVDLSPVCATAWFEWKDGNEDFDDRSELFVSMEQGLLVIGGKNPIGVTVKDLTAFHPAAQKVALSGLVTVRSGVSSELLSVNTISEKKFQVNANTGQIDTKRKFSSSKHSFTIIDASRETGQMKVKVIL